MKPAEERRGQKKIKVLYLITKANWGGAQRYVFDLSTNLPRDTFETLVASSDGVLMDKLRNANIRTCVIDALQRDINLLKEVSAFFALIKILETERPDILHLNSSKAGALGALAGRLLRVPRIIFTAHGWPFGEVHRSLLWRIVAWLGSWITVLLCHQVITVSKYDENQALAYLPFSSGKVLTIYNGASPTSLEEKEYARASLLPYAKKQPQFWIGSIGELHKNKGFDIAIRAISNLYHQGVNLTYIIIGEGEERAALEALIEEEKLTSVVHLVGFRPNAPTYLSAFELYLLPDRKVGFPYVLLEAGNAALPVVATNVGGIPEVIQSEINGILIPPKDATILTKELRKLMTDGTQQKQLGKILHQNVSTEFTLKRMLEETIALYRASLSLYS